MDEILEIVLKYVEAGGPLAGIFFPVIEAFFPILPLVAFVIINVATFGFFFRVSLFVDRKLHRLVSFIFTDS